MTKAMRLKATCKKRLSMATLQNKERIIAEIRSDQTMKKRWARYRKDNQYARNINFDGVMDALVEILTWAQ